MRNPVRKTRKSVALLAASWLCVATSASAAEAAEGTAFDAILQHYEAVRISLVANTTQDVAAHGQEIGGILERLEANWSAERAGVHADQATEARLLLPKLSAAAADLARADTLEAVRDAFYELSKPLVRFRKAAMGDDKPVVAYCSMAKRSWLQPEGELGNPYYGPSMPLCGEVVDG